MGTILAIPLRTIGLDQNWVPIPLPFSLSAGVIHRPLWAMAPLWLDLGRDLARPH